MTETPLWNGGELDVPTDDPELSNSTLKLGVLEDKPFIIYNYTLQGYKSCSGKEELDPQVIELSEFEVYSKRFIVRLMATGDLQFHFSTI